LNKIVGVRFEFTTGDGSGYVELRDTAFAAGVTGFGGYPLVALRDDDVRPRRGDLRTDGLWASITCETPGEHWSVQMEAFATGYDDPARADTDQRGDVVALGFDLEWYRDDDGWRVEGDVLVGTDRIEIGGRGDVKLP
jgi:hypothetical protein